MFTGIVGDVGVVETTEPERIWIRSPLLDDAAIGASVAVDGVCLTVVVRDGDLCRFDVSQETLARSTMGDLSAGDGVNLERAMRAGDELGGHIVQGHVDGVGSVVAVAPEGDGSRVRIEVPDALTRYMVEKGSVTVSGVSLTITTVDDQGFEVALIPHTLAVTTFQGVAPGRRFNIEVDVLGRYVERLMSASRTGVREAS